MHQQHVAGREIGEQILGAAAEALDRLALEPRHEILRQRPAQILAARLHLRESGALHDGRETAAHGLDFGQFGHGIGLRPGDIARGSGRALWFEPARMRKCGRPANADISASGTCRVDDKQALVDDVFHSVAQRYDLMNDLMSGGLHRAWKDVLVTAVNPPKNDRPFAVLDLAGGTGDIAFRLVDAGGTGTRVTVLDINRDMLEVGRGRAAERGLDDAVTFVHGNAEALPFPGRPFRCRHHRLRHPQRAADRCARWPRRSACCGSAAISCAWNSRPWTCRGSPRSTTSIPSTRSRRSAAPSPAMPRPTGIWSNRSAAFPRPDAFAEMMRTAGFGRVSFQRMSGGIVALHSGWRL